MELVSLFAIVLSTVSLCFSYKSARDIKGIDDSNNRLWKKVCIISSRIFNLEKEREGQGGDR